MAQVLTATATVGRRVKELRAKRKISAQKLANRCKDLGFDDLNRQVISNLENGRRDVVSVDELLVLAWALDVPPVLLLLPIGTDERLAITPKNDMHAVSALPWLTANEPPADPDRRLAWRAAIGPVSTYRSVRAAFYKAAAAENGDDGSFDAALRDLGREIDILIEHELAVVPLPAAWIERMKRDGLLRYPQDVPCEPDPDDADAR